MPWSSPRRSLLLLAAGLILAAGSAAQDASGEAVDFEITVLAASPSSGPIEAGAKRFHALLGKRVRYESLRVLDTHRVRVAVGDIGEARLPTGTVFRFRPLGVGPQGALVAVDMGETAQGDFRVPEGKPIILGGEAYEDGQLVVILEASGA